MSTSDTESTVSATDSLESVLHDIHILNHHITELYGLAEDLEEHLHTLRPPVENLELAQLGQLPFLAASPFRHATFAIRPPGFPGVDLSRRYPFHEICRILRTYLVSTGAVQPDGSVALTPQLKSLFEVEENTIGYIALLGHLRRVCI